MSAIPGCGRIYWVKDNEVIWEEKIQVGKHYTQTPVFKDKIRYLDFNPTWTIPPGILRRSILPKLRKDPDYLDKKYDAVSDSFSTTWSEIDVSCEACHGPGSDHLTWTERKPGWEELAADKGMVLVLDERKDVAWRYGQCA